MTVLVALLWLEWILFSFVVYTFVVSMAGFLPRRRLPRVEPRHRFAVLVPAHDEGTVVGEAVRALARIEYPRHLFRVYVVADNCSDDTASRAREAGADRVLERHDDTRRGKGYALEWATEIILAEWDPDALCVFDADNVMSSNMLAVMNDRLAAGAQVVQAYLDTKNPDDSWVTKAIATGYSVAARLFQVARENLGLSAALGGTGYCIRVSTLRAYPPDPTCLTDDCELQMRLLREGIRIHWAHEAVTYDEKPVTMRASWRQRVRWMQGHWDVAQRHALPLLWRAVRRGDLAALDGAIYCIYPSRSVVAAVVALLVGFKTGAPLISLDLARGWGVPLVAWSAAFVIYLGLPVVALLAEGVPPRKALRHLYTMVFNYTWLPIIAIGMLRSRSKQWAHTRHTRRISVEERLAAERLPAAVAEAPPEREVATRC